MQCNYGWHHRHLGGCFVGFCWVLLGFVGLVELEVYLNAQVEIPMGNVLFSQGQSKVLPSDLCDEQDRSDHHWRTWHYCGGFVNLHCFRVESTCCNKILKKQLCLCHWGATSCTYLCASWVESRWFGRDGLEIHEPFEDNTSPILETSLMNHGYMWVTCVNNTLPSKTRMKLGIFKTPGYIPSQGVKSQITPWALAWFQLWCLHHIETPTAENFLEPGSSDPPCWEE